MSEYCTVFCESKDVHVVRDLVVEQFLSSHSKTASKQEFSYTIQGVSSQLRLTLKWFTEGGDEFSHLCLGMITFIEGSSAYADLDKELLVDRVCDCKLAIGVVADPSFDSDIRYEKLIFYISKKLNGFIFNGEDILGFEFGGQ